MGIHNPGPPSFLVLPLQLRVLPLPPATTPAPSPPSLKPALQHRLALPCRPPTPDRPPPRRQPRAPRHSAAASPRNAPRLLALAISLRRPTSSPSTSDVH